MMAKRAYPWILNYTSIVVLYQKGKKTADPAGIEFRLESGSAFRTLSLRRSQNLPLI
jgi:hypothetical protein